MIVGVAAAFPAVSIPEVKRYEVMFLGDFCVHPDYRSLVRQSPSKNGFLRISPGRTPGLFFGFSQYFDAGDL